MGAIIFDFDGTIADSFEYASDFLADEARLGHLSTTQRQALRGLSMAGMARRLGFHWWSGPKLLLKGRYRLWKRAEPVPSFAGVPEVIKQLRAENYELFILTANSVRNVRRFLRVHQIEDCFSKVYSSSGFGKAPALWWILKHHGLKRQSAVYIGDEVRDIKAAEALNLGVVAVTWGFADREELVALRPAGLVDTPTELLSVLRHLSE